MLLLLTAKLVDEEYQLEDNTWVPTIFEKESIHIHFGDSTKHKYPEEMGGMLGTKEWNNEYIIHESLEGAQKLDPLSLLMIQVAT